MFLTFICLGLAANKNNYYANDVSNNMLIDSIEEIFDVDFISVKDIKNKVEEEPEVIDATTEIIPSTEVEPTEIVPTEETKTPEPTEIPPTFTPTEIPPTYTPTEIPPTYTPTEIPPTEIPTTLPPSENPDEQTAGTLTEGAKISIGVGVSLAIVIIVVAVFFICKRRRTKGESTLDQNLIL